MAVLDRLVKVLSLARRAAGREAARRGQADEAAPERRPVRPAYEFVGADEPPPPEPVPAAIVEPEPPRAPVPVPEPTPPGIRGRLRGRQSLRDAIVLKEILDRPVALRRHGRTRA